MSRGRIAVLAVLAGLVVTPARADFTLYVSGGSVISKVTPGGVVTPFVSGLGSVQGMAFDNSGNMYVADSVVNTINKITPDGSVTPIVFNLAFPVGLAFKSGTLYEADFGTGTINKITPGGSVSPFASGLSEPYGLAFDAAGNL